jgi:hypothetical protein
MTALRFSSAQAISDQRAVRGLPAAHACKKTSCSSVSTAPGRTARTNVIASSALETNLHITAAHVAR